MLYILVVYVDVSIHASDLENNRHNIRNFEWTKKMKNQHKVRQPSFFDIENKREEIVQIIGDYKKGESLVDKVNNVNHHISEITGQPAKLFAFQKRYNPLVLYSRLVELGINKKCAMDLSETYEKEVYDFINHELTEKYK